MFSTASLYQMLLKHKGERLILPRTETQSRTHRVSAI